MSMADNNPQVRVANSTFAKILFRRVGKSIVFVLGALLILYVCFALTILRVVPTTSGAGFVPIKNMTYEGGHVNKGKYILVDVSDPQGNGLLDRAKQSFVPNSSAAVVRVLEGPYGAISWVYPDILIVDGTPISGSMPSNDEGKSPLDKQDFLIDEYVVKCVKGACVEGNVFIVPAENIIGVPLVPYSTDDDERSSD